MSEIQWNDNSSSFSKENDTYVCKNAYAYEGRQYDLVLQGFEQAPQFADIQKLWEEAIEKQNSPSSPGSFSPEKLKVEIQPEKVVSFYHGKEINLQIDSSLLERISAIASSILPPILNSENKKIGSQDSNQAVEKAIREIAKGRDWKKTIQPIKVSGGHGGNYTAKIEVNGTTHYLFLKPKDEVEFNNYQALREADQDKSLEKYLPKIYGTVSLKSKKEKTVEYMIMESLVKNLQGEPLEQLADIKLAGHSEGLENAIYSEGECQATRGKPKGKITAQGMLVSAVNSPGYILTVESGKMGRMKTYPYSEAFLFQAFEQSDQGKVRELREQLKDLQKALEKTPVAHIGTSIVLLKNKKNGSLIFRLIDPAHLLFQNKPSHEGKFYVADSLKRKEEYNLRKRSNHNSLGALIQSTERYMEDALPRAFVLREENQEVKDWKKLQASKISTIDALRWYKSAI